MVMQQVAPGAVVVGDETIKAHCNGCGGVRNHTVLHSVDDSDVQDDWWAFYTYRLIRCAGCDNVHLRHDHEFSGDNDEHGNPITHTVYYPPAMSRRRPDWMFGFPMVVWAHSSDIGQLLNEVYTALQNQSLRLATMGVRAALERVMIEQIGNDTGTISGNINRFFQMGFVAPQQQPLFRNALIEAGNAAMHRGYKPTEEHLSALLDMTEALIASIYVHPQRAAALSVAIPARLLPPKGRAQAKPGGEPIETPDV